MLLGIGHVGIEPGITMVSTFNFYFYPYSHSLAGAAICSLLLRVAYFAVRRENKAVLLLGGLVFSHWDTLTKALSFFEAKASGQSKLWHAFSVVSWKL